jgi:hypothetical protein
LDGLPWKKTYPDIAGHNFLSVSLTEYLVESEAGFFGEISHFEPEALVTTCKLANPVSLVWDTKVGSARLGDLGRAERTGH